MSIRPVDLQVMVQKSVEVNKLNNNEAGRSDLAQQQFSEKLQKEAGQQDQQVVSSNKAEEQSVDKDGKGTGSQSGQKGKKRNAGNEKDAPHQPKSSSMFDVSI